jgi:hypothetical protein
MVSGLSRSTGYATGQMSRQGLIDFGSGYPEEKKKAPNP